MFKLIAKMAWKNSFLRPARTVLVVVMIAVSMGMMLGIQGLYDGMTENMLDKNKRSQSGDISLFQKEYRTHSDLQHTIADAASIKTQLQNMPEVQAVILRLRADGLASTARKSAFSSIIGINLKDEEKFGKFSDFLKKGRIDLTHKGAVIGIELAKTLKVKIGSKVIFSTQDKQGEINSIALRIRGIIQTTNISLDTNCIFIDRKYLDSFLGTSHKSASHIAIKTQSKTLYAKLKKRYPNMDVKSFLELQPMMKQMQDVMLIFNSITFFIVMSVVFIGILGVMYVSILDRIREFGIVLSIGMQYKYIRLQIFLEALFVGFIGYLSGAFLGSLILFYLKYHGLDMSEFSDSLEMWGYEAIMYGSFKLSYFVNTFLAITLASLLSVLLPLRKIKKLSPIETIKAQV